jgi:hypothetical protein
LLSITGGKLQRQKPIDEKPAGNDVPDGHKEDNRRIRQRIRDGTKERQVKWIQEQGAYIEDMN